MTRNRTTAKKAGSKSERLVAERLALGLDDDRIERRRLAGTKDRGDVASVRLPTGERVVVEVKDTSKIQIGPFLNEARVERENDAAAVGVVVAKRVGFGDKNVGRWVVLMELDDLIVLLGGERPTVGQEEES